MDNYTLTNRKLQCENVLLAFSTRVYNSQMDLKTRLKRFIDERGLNPYALSQISGVPQPTIHRILSGESTSPRDSNIKKLAIGLRISEAELRGMNETSSIEERKLLDKIHQLSDEQQQLIKAMIYNLSKTK